MLLSLVLSVTVHQLLGQPRSQRKKLLRALRKKEIIPYLQPIMSSDGTQLAGVELLARWQQPGGVMIPPDQFIPQMEDYGMIPAMTHMLMEEVAVQLAGHPNLHGLHIGINISASHCQDNALLRDCRQFLKAFKPGAVKLVLELTERQILLDDQHSHELFEELEEMGVELAIDDFGTGHSSLSYLLAFKVHTLKIDKAFVSLIGSPKKAACVGLVDGVIDMAKSMGLSIVAEGVETQEQASYLRDRGVQMLQGYLYSRPLPVATFCQDYLIESGREIEELQELVEATA